MRARADDILSNLVEWVSLRSSSSNQHLERAPTKEQQPSSCFLHPNIGLDIVERKNESKSRVLRNKGTTITSGSLVMCIPTISAMPQPLTCVDSNSTEKDNKHSHEVHSLAWHLSQKPLSILPYLDSLPSSSDLPRLWPEQKLQLLLQGSPTLKYIQENTRYVQSSYKASQETNDIARRESDGNNLPSSPTWDDYSHFHAMVTSRAFNYDTPSMETSSSRSIASLHMVPILDLCNHCRGGSDATNELQRKNVSYSFRECRDDTVKDATSGIVVDVVATKDIQPNESIRITYGAKPNSVLLVNYGFTIPNNMEPDGSSNDVLEFFTPSSAQSTTTTNEQSDGPPITILRTGPPSYTYGCFTTALQAFFKVPTSSSVVPRDNSVDNNDEMEQFLNDCEEDEDENDDDDNDEMYDDDVNLDVGTSQDDFIDNNLSRHNVTDEIQALHEFRQHLLQLIAVYSLPTKTELDWTTFIPSEDHSDSCTTLEQSRQMYAAILIYSEIRILQFYIWTTERLQQQLMSNTNPNDSSTAESKLSKPKLTLANDDARLLNCQVEELVSAYMKLRHS